MRVIRLEDIEGWPPQIERGPTRADDLLRNPDQIIDPGPAISILISYPLREPVLFNITTIGEPQHWTAQRFMDSLRDLYERIYREEAETTRTPIIPIEERGSLVNRNDTDGKYGIQGHDLSDLVLEELEKKNGVWILGIGS